MALEGVGSPELVIFANQRRLPSTVAQVLSVRHEEQPLRLEFVDRHYDFDRWIPRSFDVFHDRPQEVYVGGTVSDTATSTTASVNRGMGMMIWPPNTSDISLDFSYAYRYADLSDATDEWPGVTEEVADLVVDRAFLYCLTSNIQNDPQRAREVRVDLRIDLATAKSNDRSDPNRRRVAHGFGSSSATSHANTRWNTAQIPSP